MLSNEVYDVDLAMNLHKIITSDRKTLVYWRDFFGVSLGKIWRLANFPKQCSSRPNHISRKNRFHRKMRTIYIKRVGKCGGVTVVWASPELAKERDKYEWRVH